MRMVNEVLQDAFRKAANNWLRNKPRLFKGLAYHNYFMEINRDLIIDVRINCFYDHYYNKHIHPDPEIYITRFLEELKPALVQTLRSCECDGHIFVISFSGRGIKTTRFARISGEDK